ncbi:MAG: aminoacyl-tRNA hydrolase [Hyphomicrobium sp.]|nr:aminoacyl-tRNA hydrolase [Hyphomicrobium sp.]
MKLFVGLGNPGATYARHRHNVGFMAVERIAERHGFGPWRRRFQGYAADGELDGTKVLLLKPETYMNESGRAVGEAARFLKLGTSDIVVFHDELDLLPGKLKVKTGGGNAGHNGLRSITAHLDNEYARVRIGIGHPGAKELVQAWVLHDFSRADQDWLEPMLDAIADAAPRLAANDAARFLTDVARALSNDDDEAEKSKRRKTAEDTVPREPRPRGSHPAGERASKRATALAENLKNWLAKRRPKD